MWWELRFWRAQVDPGVASFCHKGNPGFVGASSNTVFGQVESYVVPFVGCRLG